MNRFDIASEFQQFWTNDDKRIECSQNSEIDKQNNAIKRRKKTKKQKLFQRKIQFRF